MTKSPKTPESPDASSFQAWEGSSVFVEQGKHWSSAFIWLTCLLFGSTIIWAFTAKIDQTVSVRGKLEPNKAVKSIESPSNGVVLSVSVSEGDLVSKGDHLLTVESKALTEKKASIEKTLFLLQFEAISLKSIINSTKETFPSVPPRFANSVFNEQILNATESSEQLALK